MKYRHVISLLVLPLLLVPGVGSAQTATSPQEPAVAPPSGSTAAGSDGLTSCFDYYHFGSTPIVITPDVPAIAQGGTISFNGKITNTNTYPITDVNVYVKIFRKNSTAKSSFGPDIVDWYVAKEHLVLKAGEEQPLSFTWTVPNNAQPGSYSAAVFVAAEERFNLLGLSFTNDIIGASTNFAVIGNNTGATRFSVPDIYINNHQLHAAAFSPRTESPAEGVPVAADVVNTSSTTFEGTVHWKVFSWDGLQEKNLITEKSESVTVPAHATTTLKYTVTDINHTVYYILGELDPKDEHAAKSFINPRFVTSAVSEPRINFVGMSQYPATAGATAVACVHSTGDSSAKNVTLKLFVEPHNPILKFLSFGTLSTSYSGDVSGKIRALTMPIQNALSSSFDVRAKLYQNDKLVDEVTVPYVCKELGAPCGIEEYVVWGIPAAVLILILIGMFIMLRKKKITPNPTPVQPAPMTNQPSL